MVKSIRLQNFRSYKTGKIVFCPKVNGIIGKPQSGKTNIIRALRLLVFNRPGGFRFIRNRSKKLPSFIEIKVDNNKNSIILKKSKKESFYKIGEERFEKFGKSVPDKVLKILNLSEINFQEQLQSPFLITSKPSEVSQSINEITGINDFDKWIEVVNGRIRDIKSKISLLEENKRKAKEILLSLDGIDRVESIFKRVRENEKDLAKAQRRYDFTKEKLDSIKEIKKKIRTNKEIMNFEKELIIIEQLDLKVEGKEIQLEKIKEFIEAQNDLAVIKQRHKKLLKIFISILQKNRKCPTCFKTIKKENINGIRNELSIIE